MSARGQVNSSLLIRCYKNKGTFDFRLRENQPVGGVRLEIDVELVTSQYDCLTIFKQWLAGPGDSKS
jgi:hypothetical protein